MTQLPVVSAYLAAAVDAAREQLQIHSLLHVVGQGSRPGQHKPLVWTQNPTYIGHAAPTFLDNYAYAELERNDVSSSGLLLLGPDTHYPAHSHPADEQYTVLTPGSTFEVGRETYADLCAGTIIEIPSETVHAMWTHEHPLLALYRWTGEITQPARLLVGDVNAGSEN